MKTTSTQLTKRNKSKIIVTLIGRTYAALLALVCGANLANAQVSYTGGGHTHAGLMLASQVSANGYGGVTLPGLFLKYKRSMTTLSAVVQNRRLNLSGLQLNYSYMVTGPETGGPGCEPELYFFASGAVNPKALLGRQCLKEEKMINPASRELALGDQYFSSAELFAGMGLRLKLLSHLYWVNRVGVGANTSYNFPSYQKLYYNATNIGLVLASGLQFEIK